MDVKEKDGVSTTVENTPETEPMKSEMLNSSDGKTEQKDKDSQDTVEQAESTGSKQNTSDTEQVPAIDKLAGTDAKKDQVKTGIHKSSEGGLQPKKDAGETEQNPSEQQDTKKSPSPEEEHLEESEDEGIDDIGTTEELDHSGRDAMYERGMQLEKKKKKNLALKCYLQCLKGLNNAEHFSFLPQCLRKIADIYFEKEELEKAIQFIQAEKMFYETALIDTSELEKKLEERKNEQTGEGQSETDSKAATAESVRAEEYEKLAKMCLKQNQAQLALEYQGKATKLRQQVYGNDHPVTTKSLDFFTVIYGEVGKQQYSESMQKLSTPAPEEPAATPDSPQSILRRRKKAENPESENGEENKEEKKKVRFAESQISKEQEEWISHKLLLLLFVFCVLTCGVLVFYIYCKTHTHCSSWKTEIFYYYMRIKYFYHYYFAAGRDQVIG